MSIVKNDLQARALDRIASQFQDSPNLIGHISAFVTEAEALQTAIHDMIDGLNVDDAKGVHLDAIGHIVGVEREWLNPGTFTNFAYAGAPNAQSYGTVATPSVGGRYASVTTLGAGGSLMEDVDLRLMIKTRAIANRSDSGADSIFAMIRAAFPFPALRSIYISEYDFAEVTITIGHDLTSIQQSLLLYTDIIHVAAGVRVNWAHVDSELAFGFAGSGGIGGALGVDLGKLSSLIE
jgi:hypothetical protein